MQRCMIKPNRTKIIFLASWTQLLCCGGGGWTHVMVTTTAGDVHQAIRFSFSFDD